MLLTLAVDDATWNQYLAERNARRIIKPPVPAFVAVDGVNGELSQRVEQQLAGVVGKPIDYDQLDADIMRLKGIGRFSTLSYEFIERNGQQGLMVKTEENAYGPPIVRPLILVDGSSLKRHLQLWRENHVSRYRRLSLGMAHGLHPVLRVRSAVRVLPPLHSAHPLVRRASGTGQQRIRFTSTTKTN